MHGIAQAREPEMGNHAVLPQQRDYVRNGSKGNDFQVGLHVAVGEARPEQRLDELEGYAHPAQVLLGIAAVRAARVQNGAGWGQVMIRQVVVRNDAIDAQFPGATDHLVFANPCIHAEYDAILVCGSPLDDRHAHPVAVGHTMRDEGLDPGAERPKRGEQHHHGHGPVNVVVAVDQDLLLPGNGPPQSLDRRIHAGHEERVVELVEARVKKVVGRLRVFDPSQDQQTRHHGRYIQLLAKPVNRSRIDGGYQPAHRRTPHRDRGGLHLQASQAGSKSR